MRGQMSAEFLVVISVLLSLFLIFFVVYLSQSKNLFQSQDTIDGLRNAYALSSAINYIHLAGDGASINFTLFRKGGTENVTISDVAVASVSQHSVAQAPLLNRDVNATWVDTGEMIITNSGGRIGIGQ